MLRALDWGLGEYKRKRSGQACISQPLSVVVITSALHAEGHGFKPRSDYFFIYPQQVKIPIPSHRVNASVRSNILKQL